MHGTGGEVTGMEQTAIREQDAVGTAGSVAQFLTFALGHETYGLPVEYVKEVIEYCRVFPVPRVPEHIRGVINLRGEVLPVIDLPYLFYGAHAEITPASGIVFIEVRHEAEVVVVGAVIDAVDAVTGIPHNAIEPAPAFGERIRPEYIRGVGRSGDRFIILLDPARVFDIDALSRGQAEYSGAGSLKGEARNG